MASGLPAADEEDARIKIGHHGGSRDTNAPLEAWGVVTQRLLFGFSGRFGEFVALRQQRFLCIGLVRSRIGYGLGSIHFLFILDILCRV
jgi:hypothetical protein